MSSECSCLIHSCYCGWVCVSEGFLWDSRDSERSPTSAQESGAAAAFPEDPQLKGRPVSLRYKSRWVVLMICSAVIRPGKRWLSSPSRMRHWSRVWRRPPGFWGWRGGATAGWGLSTQAHVSSSHLMFELSLIHRGTVRPPGGLLQHPAHMPGSFRTCYVQKNLPKVCWATAKKKRKKKKLFRPSQISH